ncbi:MAG: hypothetical protein R3A10_18835 [Caldilineaceae bacterium]
MTVATSNVQNTVTIEPSGTFVNEATIQTPLDTGIDQLHQGRPVADRRRQQRHRQPGRYPALHPLLTLADLAPVTSVTLVDNPGPVTNRNRFGDDERRYD